MRQWHLIYDKPTTGARNMAIDEALLESVARGISPPTLRFYAWQPMCLSLGYGQRSADVDRVQLAQNGWGVVRRMTGGKAILHGDELTYSLALPAEHPITAGGIIESYRRISQALLDGLNQLGVQVQADKKADGVKSIGPVCFETPSHYEITASDGRKLVGSAQVRRKGGVLQHGTLPLFGDVARICDALIYDSPYEREEARFHVRERATTLHDALGEIVNWETVAACMAQSFATIFDVEMLPAVVSDIVPEEEVECLQQETYANPERIYRL